MRRALRIARAFFGVLTWPSVAVKFEPRDLWIGVYWDLAESLMGNVIALDVYVCVVPCVPVVLTWGVPKASRAGDWSARQPGRRGGAGE